MFKKVLSLIAVMLLLVGMDAGAQNIRTHRINTYNTIVPNSSLRMPVTSRVDVRADEHWGGYWNGAQDEKLTMIGVELVPESYDVAICYPAGTAEVNGLTMEGVKFSFPGSQNISDLRIWMSTVQPSTAEEADILVQKVTDITDIQNTDDPFIEVRFAKPYKVDPAKDLYIGYSFKVTGGESYNELYPILIYKEQDMANSFFLKYGSYDAWMDYSQYEIGRLALQVLMSGAVPENGAALNSRLGAYTNLTGSEIHVPLTIQNTGSNGIKSMDVSVTVNDESTTLHINPEQSVEGMGTKYDYDMVLTMPSQTGVYDIRVDIQKVNGVANESETSASGKLYAVTNVAERIPFVEEFTAMWCGNCPRGFVGLQKLRQDYGDKISLVAVHSDDAMDCSADYKEVLAKVTGLPMAYVDRYYLDADPYYGYTAPYGIKDIVESSKEMLPAANIYACASIEGDILTAKSETEFLYTGDASDFGIAYIITENGLQDDSWRQANFYSSSTDPDITCEPLFEYWINEGKFVKGVVYDDVIIAARGIVTGVEGSVPAEVVEGDKNIHSIKFDLNQYGVIQNRDNLSVVAVLIDKVNGNVVNSNSVQLSMSSSIEGVSEKEDARETARYTTDGRMINDLQKGINIVKYSDGTVRKVCVK